MTAELEMRLEVDSDDGEILPARSYECELVGRNRPPAS